MLSDADKDVLEAFVRKWSAVGTDGEPRADYLALKVGPTRARMTRKGAGEQINIEEEIEDTWQAVVDRLGVAMDSGEPLIGIFAFKRGSSKVLDRDYIENAQMNDAFDGSSDKLLSLPHAVHGSSAAEQALMRISLDLQQRNHDIIGRVFELQGSIVKSTIEAVRAESKAEGLERMLRAHQSRGTWEGVDAVLGTLATTLGPLLMDRMGMKVDAPADPSAAASFHLQRIRMDAQALVKAVGAVETLTDEQFAAIGQVLQAAQALQHLAKQHKAKAEAADVPRGTVSG